MRALDTALAALEDAVTRLRARAGWWLATHPPAIPPAFPTFYVAPLGLSGGDGSAGRPWDLATLLVHPVSVVPGATVYLRGGTYGTGAETFTAAIHGTAANPITIRPYPGEIVRINCRSFVETGSYVHWLGGHALELVCTDTGTAQVATLLDLNGAGDGVRWWNAIVHDAWANGIALQSDAADHEIGGHVIFNVGRSATLAPVYAHGIYAHGTTTAGQRRTVRQNILYHTIGYGLHLYSSDAGNLTNLTVTENLLAENAVGSGMDVQVGGSAPLVDLQYTKNVALVPGPARGPVARIGYDQDVVLNTSATVTDNYHAGMTTVANFDGVALTLRRNTLVGTALQLVELRFVGAADRSGFDWDANTYAHLANGEHYFVERTSGGSTSYDSLAAWQSGTGLDATATLTAADTLGARSWVYANPTEPDLGIVGIHNPALAATVAVDLSPALSVGDRYELRHAFAPFAAPVLAGTYAGGTVAVPVTAMAAPPVVGGGFTFAAPTAEVGFFLLRKNPATVGPTHAAFRHTSFGGTPVNTDLDWLVGGPQHRYALIMSDGGVNYKVRHRGVLHQPYCLHWSSIVAQADDVRTSWHATAAAWAAARGTNVENLFLHCMYGQFNAVAPIASISPAGVVTLGTSNGRQVNTGRWVDGNGVVQTPVYAPGQIVRVDGTSNPVLAGLWTVVSVIDSTHLVLATPAGQSGTGGTINLTGDGTATLANRRLTFKWDSWRYVLNAGHADAQAFALDRIGMLRGLYDDGAFFDEHASGDLTSGVVQSVEYGTGAGATYAGHLATLLASYRATYPGARWTVNTATYVTATDAAMADAAGSCHCEMLSSFFYGSGGRTQAWNWVDARLAAGTSVEWVDGNNFNGATPQAGVDALTAAFRASGGHRYATPDERAKMGLYAQYLLLVDTGTQKRLMWDPANAFFTTSPQSARWYAAFERDVGQPLGGRTTAVSGATDGAGVRVDVFTRRFEHALVVYRPPAADSTVHDATTEYTYTLPAPPAGTTWRLLHTDNTLGNPEGPTVGLWNGDGFLFIAA